MRNQLEENIAFSGSVKDAFGNGIANARLTLNGTSYYAGSDGSFEMQLIPGTYSLIIDAAGFITFSEPDLVLFEDVNLDYALEALLFPPLNLVGEATAQTVSLTWDVPATEGTWLHWDDGENSDAVGGENIEMFDAAIRFTPGDLQSYNGQFLTRVSAFFASTDAEFLIRVWQGGNQNYAGNLVVDQPVENPVANEWNNIELANPVQVDATRELWIGYRVISTSGAYAAGTDDGPAIPFKGDMILYGSDWVSMSDNFGWNINWNIQGFVVENGRESSLLSALDNSSVQNSGLPAIAENPLGRNKRFRDFTHFNVYRNQSLLDEVPSDELSFVDETPLEENVYYVTSARGPFESVPSNEVNISFVGIPKVDENRAQLHVFPNPASEYLRLSFELNARDKMLLEMIGPKGDILYSSSHTFGAGVHNFRINRNEWSPGNFSGIVLVRLKGKLHSFSTKVLFH